MQSQVLTQRPWVPAVEDTEAQEGVWPRSQSMLVAEPRLASRPRILRYKKILTIGSVMEMKFLHLIIDVQRTFGHPCCVRCKVAPKSLGLTAAWEELTRACQGADCERKLNVAMPKAVQGHVRGGKGRHTGTRRFCGGVWVGGLDGL